MVIINNYVSGDQIQHRKMKILVRKQCLLQAKMFSNGFVVAVGSQTRHYHGGENLKQVVLHKISVRSSLCHKNLCGDDDFQRAKSPGWFQASESFLSCHFAEIPTWNDSSGGLVACRGPFSVQKSTLRSCWSSFLSFEPSF